MAKMRFNIGIEKAKRVDLEKDVEVEDVAQKIKKKLEAEIRLRKTNLMKATNENHRLNHEVKVQKKEHRQQFLREIDSIQTSLFSKKDDTMREDLRLK